ncbi:MAG: hypothetical protein AAF960_00625 [Bacteroidota bacterium]
MKKKFIIEEESGKNKLIEVDEIRKLLKSNDDELIFVFESGKTDDEYRKSLQKELPKYHVFNVRWMPEIWIYPSIATNEILEKKEEIYQAACSFRKDGIRLMKMLGETYQINPFEGRTLFDLRRKSRDNGQREKVNKEWTFWFHGAECQFKNRITGQIVELIITNGSEFGALDSFFFLRYLKTTSKFKELANFFLDDSKAITKAFNLLEDLGKLRRISNISQRGVIAK